MTWVRNSVIFNVDVGVLLSGLSIMEEGNSNFIDISMGGGRVGRGQSAESEWDHWAKGRRDDTNRQRRDIISPMMVSMMMMMRVDSRGGRRGKRTLFWVSRQLWRAEDFFPPKKYVYALHEAVKVRSFLTRIYNTRLECEGNRRQKPLLNIACGRNERPRPPPQNAIQFAMPICKRDMRPRPSVREVK